MESKTSKDAAKTHTAATLALEIEELEDKIAPGRGLNHNEVIVCEVEN